MSIITSTCQMDCPRLAYAIATVRARAQHKKDSAELQAQLQELQTKLSLLEDGLLTLRCIAEEGSTKPALAGKGHGKNAQSRTEGVGALTTLLQNLLKRASAPCASLTGTKHMNAISPVPHAGTISASTALHHHQKPSALDAPSILPQERLDPSAITSTGQAQEERAQGMAVLLKGYHALQLAMLPLQHQWQQQDKHPGSLRPPACTHAMPGIASRPACSAWYGQAPHTTVLSFLRSVLPLPSSELKRMHIAHACELLAACVHGVAGQQDLQVTACADIAAALDELLETALCPPNSSSSLINHSGPGPLRAGSDPGVGTNQADAGRHAQGSMQQQQQQAPTTASHDGCRNAAPHAQEVQQSQAHAEVQAAAALRRQEGAVHVVTEMLTLPLLGLMVMHAAACRLNLAMQCLQQVTSGEVPAGYAQQPGFMSAWSIGEGAQMLAVSGVLEGLPGVLTMLDACQQLLPAWARVMESNATHPASIAGGEMDGSGLRDDVQPASASSGNMVEEGCSMLTAAIQQVLEAHAAASTVAQSFSLASQQVVLHSGQLSVVLQALAVRVEDDGSRGMFAATCKDLCKACWGVLTPP